MISNLFLKTIIEHLNFIHENISFNILFVISGPMQVAQPRLFPRHPSLPPGIRPPFMPPPGFQIPIAPQSEPSVSMANPAVSGAATSSAPSQIPGSAPDGVASSMAAHHGIMPPMAAPAGALPPHIFGSEGRFFISILAKIFEDICAKQVRLLFALKIIIFFNFCPHDISMAKIYYIWLGIEI